MVQHEVSCWAIGYIDAGVPTNIASAKCGDACCSIVGEYPLVAVGIFEVADVQILVAAIDDWRIARGDSMAIADFQ